MATIFEVAKYIVEKLGTMTTMKMQKLTYYCQAWSLAWDGKPLFNEDFQAWANGPVNYELFTMHKGNFSINNSSFASVENGSFTKSEKDTLDSVLKFYGDKEPLWLSELTHKEAPWKNARNGCAAGMPCSNIISKESMQEYYSGLVN